MIWPLIKRWRLEEYIVFGFFWWLYNAAKRAHLSFSRISEAGKVGLCLWTAGYHLDVVVKLVRRSDPLELCRLGPWSLGGSTLPDWWRSTVQTENNLSFLPVAGWAWDQWPLLVKKKTTDYGNLKAVLLTEGKGHDDDVSVTFLMHHY